MKTYNIHDAKTHFSRLVEAAAAGQEVIIAKAGKPVAKLVALSAVGRPRELGALTGQVREAPDCWEPDPEIESLLYGGPIEPHQHAHVAERPTEEEPRE